MQDLQQTLLQFLDLLKGIWIKKRHVIIMSWMICPIGFFMVANLPDQYTSTAKLSVADVFLICDLRESTCCLVCFIFKRVSSSSALRL